MQYHSQYAAEDDWDVYFFEKNLQDDIIAVYDEYGTLLIEYTYSAYGKCTYTEYESTSATNNPFRYRGYYFDEGLNLYYLESRYYDQNTGRFINADFYVSTGTGLLGYNMYAYCNNNPVMMVDYSGEWPTYEPALDFSMFMTFMTVLSVASIVNLCINYDNKKKIDSEIEDLYTNESAVDAINSYLNEKYNCGDVSVEDHVFITIETEGFKINNGYRVDNRYDRQYISMIISRVGEGRGVGSACLSSEWLGHNICHAFYPQISTQHTDLNKNGDGRLEIDIISKLLAVHGWE